jgi:fatty-acyl-CoA synthase
VLRSTGSGRVLSRSLIGLLREQAVTDGSATALVAEGGEWTYAEWLECSERVAWSLDAAGVGKDDVVALLAPNSLEWLAVAFGCAAVGARLVPISTWVQSPELHYLLSYSKPKVLVTVGSFGNQHFLEQLGDIVPELLDSLIDHRRSAEIPSLQHVVVIGNGEIPPGAVRWADWLAERRWRRAPAAAADDIAWVLFTSGSTARPKGVALVHGDLIDNGFEIGERQGLHAGDRLFLASPMFWSFGSANALMAALTHRTALVLQSSFDAGLALQLIEHQRCTAAYLLTPMVHALIDHPAFDRSRLKSLRRGLTFGSPAEVRRVIEVLGVDLVCNIYGSTELYGNCAVSPSTAPAERRIASSGPSLRGVEVQVVHPETRAACEPGEIGEIRVRGRVSPGYLNSDGGLTSVVDADGWFVTCDLGSIDADGWVTFAGRDSDMIKTSGINVSPAEVEEMLLGHEDVLEAAVTGAAHPIRGEQVVAFVRLRHASVVDPEDIRNWAKSRAASYKVPMMVLVVNDFPTTATGKLARRELRNRAEEVANAN